MAATTADSLLEEAGVFMKGILHVGSMLPFLGGPISVARSILKDVERLKDQVDDVKAAGQRAANVLEILELFAENAKNLDDAAQDIVRSRIEELNGLLSEMKDAFLEFGRKGFLRKMIRASKKAKTLSALDKKIQEALGHLRDVYNLAQHDRINQLLKAQTYKLEAAIEAQLHKHQIDSSHEAAVAEVEDDENTLLQIVQDGSISNRVLLSEMLEFKENVRRRISDAYGPKLQETRARTIAEQNHKLQSLRHRPRQTSTATQDDVVSLSSEEIEETFQFWRDLIDNNEKNNVKEAEDATFWSGLSQGFLALAEFIAAIEALPFSDNASAAVRITQIVVLYGALRFPSWVYWKKTRSTLIETRENLQAIEMSTRKHTTPGSLSHGTDWHILCLCITLPGRQSQNLSAQDRRLYAWFLLMSCCSYGCFIAGVLVVFFSDAKDISLLLRALAPVFISAWLHSASSALERERLNNRLDLAHERIAFIPNALEAGYTPGKLAHERVAINPNILEAGYTPAEHESKFEEE